MSLVSHAEYQVDKNYRPLARPLVALLAKNSLRSEGQDTSLLASLAKNSILTTS